MATHDYSPSMQRPRNKDHKFGAILGYVSKKGKYLERFPILYITKNIYDSWEELKYQQFQEFGRS